MYYMIYDHSTNKTERIYTKKGAIARVKELFDYSDSLKVSSEYLKELPDKDAFSKMPDITSRYIIENCMENPYAIRYENFDIRCIREYEIEGIEEQLFELEELTEPLFYYDHDLTFEMAIKWFKTTEDAKDLNENPLGISWEKVVRRDYRRGTFNNEYSDNLVDMYIDNALYMIGQMSTGDVAIFNDLKITCH